MGLSIPKLLVPAAGRPILARVLDLVEALPLAERVLILGAHCEEILAALFHLAPPPAKAGWDRRAVRPSSAQEWRLVHNSDWPEGMGSSLRRAAEAVEGGMLVFLGDMPFVPRQAAEAVLMSAGARPVAPSFLGQRGFPVYLPASLRPKLRALAGDVGARALIPDCQLIPWDDPGVVWDVDEIGDLGGEGCEVCRW